MKKFHARGFVHGDIHLGNFVVQDDDGLRLVDFDRSVPYVDVIGRRHVRPRRRMSYGDNRGRLKLDPTFLSVYELGGSTTLSRRDDWMRLAELLVNLVSRTDELWREDDDILESKRNREFGDIFFVFREFYESSLLMEFDERPKYEEWIEKFEELLSSCVKLCRVVYSYVHFSKVMPNTVKVF